jgi:hypothetical protein
VSIELVAFSVTTRTCPFGVNWIWAGPTEAPLSGRVEPAIGVSTPCASTRKPLMVPALWASPAFRT